MGRLLSWIILFHCPALLAAEPSSQADECMVPTVRFVKRLNQYGFDQVHVTRKIGDKTVTIPFGRSLRSWDELLKWWPKGTVQGDDLMKGRWLDVGTSDGIFVLKGREKGMDIVGVDIHLKDFQKFPKYKGIFYEADGLNLPFKDSEFRRLQSIDSFLSYHPIGASPENEQIWRKGLKEFHRVVSDGGEILIGSVQGDRNRVAEIIREVGGFEIVRPNPTELQSGIFENMQNVWLLRVKK